MRKIVFILVFFVSLFAFSKAWAKEYTLLISLKYSSGEKNITVSQIALLEGEAATYLYQPKDGYLLTVLSAEGKELYMTKFLLPGPPAGTPPRPEWFDEKGNQVVIPGKDEPTGLPKIEQLSLDLTVPYFLKANLIEIYNPSGVKILSANVPKTQLLIDDLVKKELALEDEASRLGGAEKAFLIFIIVIILAVILFIFKRNAFQR